MVNKFPPNFEIRLSAKFIQLSKKKKTFEVVRVKKMQTN